MQKNAVFTKQSWSHLVSRFPLGFFHIMLDPIYSDYPWKYHSHVSQYSIEDWLSGSPPQCDTISIWENESVENHLPLFRDPTTKITIFSRQGDDVVFISGVVAELVEQCPLLFLSRQLQRIRVSVGLPLSSISIGSPVIEHLDKYLFVEFSLPRVSHARAFRGDPSSVRYEAIISGVRWRFCTKSTGEPVDVEPGILSTYLDLQRTAPEEKDYLSLEYYLDNFASYTSWTYEVHFSQACQVLRRLSSSRIVCAPGDGCGIVASAWSHIGHHTQVVSGDLAANGETFSQTMFRAPSDAVLVLSYVWSLMSESDREIVKRWTGPVIFIEPRDLEPFPGLVHYGPGLFGRSLPSKEEPIIRTAESLISYESVLFSENLLRLPEISYFKKNIAVQYYQTMRPLSSVSSSAPIVVADLVELLSADKPSALSMWQLSGGSVKIYLACIGRLFSGFVPLLGLSPKFAFKSRTVYQFPNPSVAEASFITRHFFTCMVGRVLYFCSPSPIKEYFFTSASGKASRFLIDVTDLSTEVHSPPFLRAVCVYHGKIALQVSGRFGWYQYSPWLYWNVVTYHRFFFVNDVSWIGRVSPYNALPERWIDWPCFSLLTPAQQRFVMHWDDSKMNPDIDSFPMYWLRKENCLQYALFPYQESIHIDEVNESFEGVDRLFEILSLRAAGRSLQYIRQGDDIQFVFNDEVINLTLGGVPYWDSIMDSCELFRIFKAQCDGVFAVLAVRDGLSRWGIDDCLDSVDKVSLE